MPSRFSASAPGTMMIMGEHAVIWGAPCLVAAVNQRLTVTLEARNDHKIHLSSMYGEETFTNVANIQSDVHQFIAAAIKMYAERLPSGFKLTVSSQVMSGKGFGSSAAVIVATQAVLQQFCGLSSSPYELIIQGRTIVRQIQGHGSGADVAAATLGGIVLYQPEPLQTQVIKAALPLTAVFCGYKTPTAEVLRLVEARRQQHPEKFKQLTLQATQLIRATENALDKGDLPLLGNLFEEYQQLMQAFGVEDTASQQALQFLRQQPGILGAKISGSGLGDCIIGCGHVAEDFSFPTHLSVQGMEIIPVQLTEQGVGNEPL
jgi:mevalonate kinase